MKAKVKFDKNQLKPLLIQHVEKLVFGVLAFAALLLCWSAIGLSPYQGTPEELNKKAADVRTRVASSKPPEKFDDLPAKRNLSGMLHNALVAVNPALFPMPEISRPYSDHKVRRQQPTLLVVEDPRATAGFGAIAMSEQPQGRDRLIAGRDPPRSRMGGMDVGMMGPGGGMPDMMGPGGGMEPGGAPPGGMMDPEQMREMMQQAGGMPGADGGMPPGGMMDPQMMQEMMGGMNGMRPNRRERKKKPKLAPKPKAKPVYEPEKMALEVPAGAKLEGRYWVAVVGLIPNWDQEAEFQKVFRDATKTYPTDTPEYVFCDIERAEIGTSGETGEFVALDMDQVIDDMEKWGAVYPEKIDKKYLTPTPDVTAPLPPLVRANHDSSAIRHPKIPLADEASAEENKAAAEAAADLKDDPDGEGKGRRGRRGGRGRSAMPRGMQMGGMMGNMMGMGGGMNASGVAREKIEYKLFRFFDFTVELGKKYKYRIRLALENPNWEKPVQYLQSPDLAKEEFVYTGWSEPTPEVFVPLGSELLAGDVSPKDPSAKILVRQFDREKAMTAVHIFDLERGATANKQAVEVPAPKTASAAPGPAENAEKVDFHTDATMVDLVGGDKLAGFSGTTGIKSPGRMLVMRSDGELAMLSEFSDAEKYELEEYLFKEAKEADKANPLGGAADGKGKSKDKDKADNPFGNFNDIAPQKPRRGR